MAGVKVRSPAPSARAEVPGLPSGNAGWSVLLVLSSRTGPFWVLFLQKMTKTDPLSQGTHVWWWRKADKQMVTESHSRDRHM